MDVNLNPIVYEVAKTKPESSKLHNAQQSLPQAFLESKSIPGSWDVFQSLDELCSEEVDHLEEDESGNNMASADQKEDQADPFTAEEIFDLIRHINDPEHPLTLEQLRVAQLELIQVDNTRSSVDIKFTPTIPHCSMATMIGLCLRVKLLRSLPKRMKVRISITPGTHSQEAQVTKQLNDKERVAAALENTKLLAVVDRCILTDNEDSSLVKNIAGTRERPNIYA